MILLLLGGVLGSVGAFVGLVVFGVGWVAALGLWMGGGILGAAVAVLLGLRREASRRPAPAHASPTLHRPTKS